VALARHEAFGIARQAGAAHEGAHGVDPQAVPLPISPVSAEQRSPSQRMPD
jgi:hypothetical protein